MSAPRPDALAPSEVRALAEMVAYAEAAVVSRTLVKNPAGTVTLFAFDQGQELSEHSAPFDALVQVVDGEGEFRIAGEPHRVRAGEVLLMPADIPHSVHAVAQFKMLLTMLKAGAGS